MILIGNGTYLLEQKDCSSLGGTDDNQETDYTTEMTKMSSSISTNNLADMGRSASTKPAMPVLVILGSGS